jgi:hypothetical protein
MLGFAAADEALNKTMARLSPIVDKTVMWSSFASGHATTFVGSEAAESVV